MRERKVSVDLMRIVAAIVIFLFHSSMHMGSAYWIFTDFIEQGAIVMVAFFMISGFALCYTYYDADLNTYPSIKRFYVKRIIGLYAPYFFICVVFLILDHSLPLMKKNTFITNGSVNAAIFCRWLF